jgi:heat-inducible transcriptional repressor
VDRRLSVLRAIVEEFVRSGEPVGSKVIAQKHSLGVSPATIRNDMASLEDEGLITAPHTSAGRIPTDLGYRTFVDKLSSVKPLSIAERNAIEQFLGAAVDLDDIMSRTTKILSTLTNQVAIVQYPTLQRTTLRHIDLVGLTNSRIMVIVISSTGRVEQQLVEVKSGITDSQIDDLKQLLNHACANKNFSDIPEILSAILLDQHSVNQEALGLVIQALSSAVVERGDERVLIAGTSNVTKFESVKNLAPLLEALEENVVLLKLLGEITGVEALEVKIGKENSLAGLLGTSVVTSSYKASDVPVAKLGIVGSTHMDYEVNMAAVSAVANYISRFLQEAQ